MSIINPGQLWWLIFASNVALAAGAGQAAIRCGRAASGDAFKIRALVQWADGRFRKPANQLPPGRSILFLASSSEAGSSIEEAYYRYLNVSFLRDRLQAIAGS